MEIEFTGERELVHTAGKISYGWNISYNNRLLDGNP